jgi:hypothetical protein
MIPTISIRDLHLEYQFWTRELIFYKEEIKIFEDHLLGILRRNASNGVPAQVEHFKTSSFYKKK